MSTTQAARDVSVSQPTTVKTRVLIISDTHNATLRPSVKTGFGFREPMHEADILIHCGDLTLSGKLHEYEKTISMLASIKAELKLVIAGNHDTSLDPKFHAKNYQRFGFDRNCSEEARDMWTGSIAAAAGITFLDEGIHSFNLSNGAEFTVYATPFQPEFCDWAFPYERHEDRYNPPDDSRMDVDGYRNISTNPVPDFPVVDIMVTHGPPLHILDRTYHSDDVGCPHLLRAAHRARPRLHCFGHIHEGWGAQRIVWDEHSCNGEHEKIYVDVDKKEAVEARAAYLNVSATSDTPLGWDKETLMVNAAIMDIDYIPRNAPWLVDLELRKRR